MTVETQGQGRAPDRALGVLLTQSPGVRSAGQPLVQRGPQVRGAVPPVRQRTEPDVDASVSHGKDPAVPREVVIAAREAEIGPQLQVLLLGSFRAAVVAASGCRDLLALVPLQAHGEGEAGGGAVGGDDDRCVEDHRLLRSGHGGDAGDAAGAVGQGPGHLHAAAQPCSGSDGVVGEDVVEVMPTPREAEVRVAPQSLPVDVYLMLTGHPSHTA